MSTLFSQNGVGLRQDNQQSSLSEFGCGMLQRSVVTPTRALEFAYRSFDEVSMFQHHGIANE